MVSKENKTYFLFCTHPCNEYMNRMASASLPDNVFQLFFTLLHRINISCWWCLMMCKAIKCWNIRNSRIFCFWFCIVRACNYKRQNPHHQMWLLFTWNHWLKLFHLKFFICRFKEKRWDSRRRMHGWRLLGEWSPKSYKCRIYLCNEVYLYVLGHMCFSCYRTHIMILCNWLILWQNVLYLYLGRLRICLNTSRNHVSRSSVEAFKSIQEIKKECKFIKARQLVDIFSTPPICRGLRIS